MSKETTYIVRKLEAELEYRADSDQSKKNGLYMLLLLSKRKYFNLLCKKVLYKLHEEAKRLRPNQLSDCCDDNPMPKYNVIQEVLTACLVSIRKVLERGGENELKSKQEETKLLEAMERKIHLKIESKIRVLVDSPALDVRRNKARHALKCILLSLISLAFLCIPICHKGFRESFFKPQSKVIAENVSDNYNGLTREMVTRSGPEKYFV